jgi:hypothetical protein
VAEASPDPIAAHITAIAGRTHAQGELLSGMLTKHSWPGGRSDHSKPAAHAWLRRWRPKGPLPALIACSCAGGRCEVCN